LHKWINIDHAERNVYMGLITPLGTDLRQKALRELGVGEEGINRVHRPVGLNIGSRTPPEIAVATLAGLIADRNARPGGFAF
jgi:xanthine/CO dehydrogenase XdhC/CoxF family maturation factor